MHTATIMAAAVFGYTWGYQPLDNHTTEFLVQMSQEDIRIMADGASEILLDIPPDAGPVGRVRIIVGDEKLPRESLPPNELDTAQTAERPSLPANEPDPSRAPPFAARDRDRYPPADRDARNLNDTAGRDPAGHRLGPGGHRDPNAERGGATPIEGPTFTNTDIGPPAISDNRREEPGRREMADQYENFAPVTLNPYDTNRDANSAQSPQQDDLIAPPLNTAPGFANDPMAGTTTMDERYDDRDRLRRDGMGMVDATTSNGTDPQHTIPNDVTRGALENSLVERVGPALTAVQNDPTIDWTRITGADESQRRQQNDDSRSPEHEGRDHAGHDGSPSDESVDAARRAMEIDSNAVSRWRWWTVLTSSTAFGLFVLNFYQWGTYKSIRQRYLSLLRRTGEV